MWQKAAGLKSPPPYLMAGTSRMVFRRPENFAKPDICRTRAGGCPAQSSALLALHISENKKFSIKSSYLIVFVLMVTTCPTTEAALQTGLLPTQERRKGRFAKASALVYIKANILPHLGRIQTTEGTEYGLFLELGRAV